MFKQTTTQSNGGCVKNELKCQPTPKPLKTRGPTAEEFKQDKMQPNCVSAKEVRINAAQPQKCLNGWEDGREEERERERGGCLLYTSDAADER